MVGSRKCSKQLIKSTFYGLFIVTNVTNGPEFQPLKFGAYVYFSQNIKIWFSKISTIYIKKECSKKIKNQQHKNFLKNQEFSKKNQEFSKKPGILWKINNVLKNQEFSKTKQEFSKKNKESSLKSRILWKINNVLKSPRS